MSEKDISALDLPKGDTLILTEAVGKLQVAKGGGPLCANKVLMAARQTWSIDNILERSGTINTADTKGPTASSKAGEHSRTVDFIPSGALVNEEEVALQANITKTELQAQVGDSFSSNVGGGKQGS